MSINALIERIQAAKPVPDDLLNGEHRACLCPVCTGTSTPRNPDRKPGV